MNTPLISVIIPVYNVNPYLRTCLDSVVNQTYANLEIILVDDGSTDGSGAICEEYKKKDVRIVVIHKNNGGLSDARNTGLNQMQGEYVTFVDSDDYLDKNYLKRLYDCIEKMQCEYAICSYFKVAGNGKRGIARHKPIEVYEQRETMLNMLYRKKMSMYAHGKLYKSTLFEDIRFPVGRKFEDVPTTWSIVKKVERIAYIDEKLYFYRQRKGSIVNSIYSHEKMDQVYFASDILEEVHKDEELYRAAVSKYFFSLTDIYSQVDKKHKEDQRYLEGEIRKYHNVVLCDSKCNKLLRGMALLSYLPLPLVGLAGTVYKNILQLIYKKK